MKRALAGILLLAVMTGAVAAKQRALRAFENFHAFDIVERQ